MRQYEMAEIILKGPEPEGSFSSVDLSARICGGGEEVCVKGFYDGDGTYKVRFLPKKAGEYTYQVTGLLQAEGKVQVEPSDGSHHGLVQAEGTHLRHEDGTWFYSFGTTVYGLVHQEESRVEETLQTLSENAFNKVRMCLFPKHYVYNKNEPRFFAFERNEEKGIVEFTDNLSQPRKTPYIDTARPVFAFWHDLEEKILRLQEMGIQVDLILFHPYDRWGHSHMTQAQNLEYLDYAIRRLSAFPNIWWSMANEYDIFFSWEIQQWYEVEEFIASHDPYHHLLSNHNCFAPYDFGRENITHVSLQNRAMARVFELQQKFGKPVCYDECAYEGNLKETWGSISAQEMVNRFWQCTVNGGYCTHGEVLLDRGPIDLDNAVLWWAKGGKLKGQSPKRIAYLRSVIEGLGAPLDPYLTGFGQFRSSSREELHELIQKTTGNLQGVLKAIDRMNDHETLIHLLPEYDYSGHIGESIYLFYLGANCSARYVPQVVKDKTYKVEVIDAWNMTRETICESLKAGDEIELPGHEYIAVLCTAKD